MKICLRIILLQSLFIILLISWSRTLKGQLLIVNPSQKQEVKIAMAQIFCLDGDRAGNFLRIENAIIEAKNQKAEIITFPESCILGWVNPTAHQRAFPIPGEDCLEELVSNLFPASILQLHKDCICFLDRSSSALLTRINVEVQQEFIE